MIIVAPQAYVDRLNLLRRLGGDCSVFDELKVIVPNKKEQKNLCLATNRNETNILKKKKGDMKISKIVYIAEVCEEDEEHLKKVWTDILETKEAAIKFCIEIVKQRYKEIYNVKVVTVRDLLKFSKDRKHIFHLMVSEYGGNRLNPDKEDECDPAFKQAIMEGGENLYSNLLNTVISNYSFYDYFGNVMSFGTEPFCLVNYKEGYFAEEDCKNGVYNGEFAYNSYREGHLPTEKNNIFYYLVREIRKEADLRGRTYSMNSWYYNHLDKALEDGKQSLYWDLEEYFPENESEDGIELTPEQDKIVFDEKVKEYSLRILVTHGNKLLFSTQKELADYYADTIENGKLRKEEFYEFLLSLVLYEERHYDKDGNLLRSRIVRQSVDQEDSSIIPEFSMETAEKLYETMKKRKEELDFGRTR